MCAEVGEAPSCLGAKARKRLNRGYSYAGELVFKARFARSYL